MLRNKRNLVLLAATAGIVQATALLAPALAATGTWNGASDGSWSNALNWTGGIPNATADDAIFNTAGATNLNVLANAGTLTIRSLQFNANATNPVTLNIGSVATGGGTFIIAGQTGDDVM